LSIVSLDAMHSLGSHRVYIHGIHQIKSFVIVTGTYPSINNIKNRNKQRTLPDNTTQYFGARDHSITHPLPRNSNKDTLRRHQSIYSIP